MPKPGTSNTLMSPFKTPLTQFGQTASQPLTTLAQPKMNTIQPSGFSSFGTPIQPSQQSAPAPKAAAPAPVAAPAPQQQQPIQKQPTQVNPNQQFNQQGGSQPLAYMPSYSGLVGQIGQTAQDNQAIGQRAADIAAQYGKQIADVGQQGAKFRAGQLTTGTTPVAEGNAAVTAQTIAAQQSALAAGESAALQGTGQQLTAQGQAQSGLGLAAGYAQPSVAGFGQGTFNPLTGQIEGGGGNNALNPLNNVQSIAEQVISGQISPSQAYSMGGSVQNWQGVLNQAILTKNPQFNIAQAEGSFSARQQNTQTAGTAATSAYASAYQQNYPEYLQVGAQLQNVENLGSLLLKTGQGGQVNPFDAKFGNYTLSQFRQQLSDSDQAKFNNTLAAYATAVSQLLGNSSSVTPTQITEFTTGIVDGTLKMDAIKAAYEQSLQEGKIKQTTAASLVNQPGGAIGAPKVGNTGGGDYNAYKAAIGAK